MFICICQDIAAHPTTSTPYQFALVEAGCEHAAVLLDMLSGKSQRKTSNLFGPPGLPKHNPSEKAFTLQSNVAVETATDETLMSISASCLSTCV